MWKGVIFAYIIVALCYFPVALIGYRMFGNNVEDNILISLDKPTWLIVMANMFVVIHVIGSYQLCAMPVFDMMETVLVKKLHFPPSHYFGLLFAICMLWSSWFLWRICLCPNYVFRPMRNVARCLQA